MCKYCRDDDFWLDRVRHEDAKPLKNGDISLASTGQIKLSPFDQAAAELRLKMENK